MFPPLKARPMLAGRMLLALTLVVGIVLGLAPVAQGALSTSAGVGSPFAFNIPAAGTPSITLTPGAQTVTDGTAATLTATVKGVNDQPVGNVTVTFLVVSGPNAGATSTSSTNPAGQTSFSYADAVDVTGTDSVMASDTYMGTTYTNTASVRWVDPPIVVSGLTVSATEGAAFSGAVATFTDPDTTAGAGQYAATIDWGDGQSSAGTVSGGGGSFSVSGSHTYAEEGSDPITVSIADVGNASNAATADSTATVGDAALDATGVNVTSQEAFSGTAATFTDANAGSTAADFTATIDWGDGSSSAGSVTGSGGSFSVAGSHTYSGTGSFTATVNIVDVGGSAATASSMIVILVASPSGSPGAPTVAAGPPTVSTGSAAFTATVNPNAAPTSVHFEYGLDVKYGLTSASNIYPSSTPDQSVGSGSTPQTVTANVTGLVPNATYHFRVVASNAQGTVSSSDQTFTTAALPPPPPPVIGTEANFIPVSGTVYVKLPGLRHGGPDVGFAAALTKGVGFVPLTQARQLPIGTQVDARAGTLKLVTATSTRKGKRTTTQSGDFSQGLFQVAQSTNRKLKGLTTLNLLDNGIFPGAPSYRTECATVGKTTNGGLVLKPRHLSKKVLQSLTANEHGNYQTKGKYSAATVRGTIFTVTDRCDATVTSVRRGSVSVTVYRRPKKPITLHAGQTYVAKAP